MKTRVARSGWAFPARRGAGGRLNDYVRKPYRPEKLFECMARQLGLQYRRGEAQPRSQGEPITKLRPELLAALPDDSRTQLREALIELNVKGISRTIESVTKWDAALGSVLAVCRSI